MSVKDPFVEMIRDKIVNDDRWLIRGILAIYERQTEDEKASESTNKLNGIGFNAFDAQILSAFAKQIERWQVERQYPSPLSSKQLQLARRKMTRYAGQLARIAQEKKTV